MPKLFEATSAEDWTWLLQLNIVGTRNVVAAALPHLKETAGRIVLVSSSAGQVGVFGFSAYSVSRASRVDVDALHRPFRRQASLRSLA